MFLFSTLTVERHDSNYINIEAVLHIIQCLIKFPIVIIYSRLALPPPHMQFYFNTGLLEETVTILNGPSRVPQLMAETLTFTCSPTTSPRHRHGVFGEQEDGHSTAECPSLIPGITL